MNSDNAVIAEIERHPGPVPLFVRTLPMSPELRGQFWSQTKAAHLNSPLPHAYKERVCVLVAQRCASAYPLVYHCCALAAIGVDATAIWHMVTLAATRNDAVIKAVQSGVAQPHTELPTPDSELGTAMVLLVASCFIPTQQNAEHQAFLRRWIGDAAYSQFIALLAYCKTVHMWLESYPDINYHDDPLVQHHLPELLAREPRLAELFRPHPQQAMPVVYEAANGNQTATIGTVQALRESEQRYTSLIEQSLDAIVIIRDATIVHANAAWLALVGASNGAETLGRSVYDFVTPAWQGFARERSYVFDQNQQQVLAVAEIEIMRLDGQPVHVEVTPVLIQWQGEPAIQSIVRDVSTRKQAARQQQFLQQASDMLAASLDYATTLHTLTQLVVPEFADAFAIYLERKDHAFHPVVWKVRDPADAALFETLLTTYRLAEDSPHSHVYVVRTGKSELVPTVDLAWEKALATDAEHLDLIRQLGVCSAITIPLIARGHALGSMLFRTTKASRRHYTSNDLALLEELARRAALAIDNARIYRDAQRRVAELATVQHVAQAINSSLQLNQLFQTIVEAVVGAFHYQLVSIYLVEEPGLVLQAYTGYSSVIPLIRLDQGMSGRAVRTKETVFVANASEDPDFLSAIPDVRQAIAVPLKRNDKGEEVLGVFMVEGTESLVLIDDDVIVLELLADQISVALVNARLYAETQAALTARDESLARIDTLFQSVPVGLAFLDTNMHYIRVNETLVTMSEVPREAHSDSTPMQLFPTTAHETEALLRRVLATGETIANHEVTVSSNGRPRTFLCTFYPVYISNGVVETIGVAVVEITDRKRIEEQQRTLERKMLETQKLESLGVLAGGVAHDFNNLLMVVLGNVELALLDLPPDSDTYAGIEKVSIAAQRAAELVGQMLTYAGKSTLIPEPVDLNVIIVEMLSLLRVSISKQTTLETKLAADLPVLQADPTQVRQVIMNLITNASEALEGNQGTVTVCTSLRSFNRSIPAPPYLPLAEAGKPGTYVALEVADTGTGIAPTTLRRIFDPFFTTKVTGRGLGLPAVLGVIRGHAGMLFIDSKLGEGTTMTVLLPIDKPPAQARASAQPAQLAPPSTRLVLERTVLVIDDEAEVCRTTQKILQHLGLNVLTAQDGHTGIELAQIHAHELSAILLDWTMPRMTGEATLHMLTQYTPRVPVVVMSGYSPDVLSDHATKATAIRFLQKPFTVATLRSTMEQVLA